VSNSTPDTLLTHSATLDLLQYTEGHTVHGEYTDEVWEISNPPKKYTPEFTTDEEEVLRCTRKILLNY